MRVGKRMVGGAQAVELADKGKARPGQAAADPALDPGQREPRLRLETELQIQVAGGANQREAVRANLEKRPPRFRDPA